MSTEATRALTESLLKGNGYGGKSPLQQMVDVQVEKMAREIAVSIVAENPELRAEIERRTRDVVALVLRDERWMQATVVSAVSKALMQRGEED